MLRVFGDRDRLVDKQHRDTVLNPVRTPKSRVVERLVADQQKRTPVLRTDQDAQKFFVKHSGRSTDRGAAGAAENRGTTLVEGRRRSADGEAGVGARCLLRRRLRLDLALVGDGRLEGLDQRCLVRPLVQGCGDARSGSPSMA